MAHAPVVHLAYRYDSAAVIDPRPVLPSIAIAELAHRIAPGTELSDPEGRWPQVVGLSDSGALLIRPDGYVVWRAPAVTSRPAAALADALNEVLGRGAQAPRNAVPAGGVIGEGPVNAFTGNSRS